MRDRHNSGDDSGYAGFVFFMMLIGMPIFIVAIFAMIGVVLTN